MAEIDRVAGQTNFNGVKLLDGGFAAQSFQVGANVGETIVVSSLANATKGGLGLDNGSASATGSSVSGVALAQGELTINGSAVGAVATASARNIATAMALQADYVVLGGGNAKRLKRLPKGVRLGDNGHAFTGGFRLWDRAWQDARPSCVVQTTGSLEGAVIE